METVKRKPVPMKLLGLVCERHRKNTVHDILEEKKAFFHLATLGKGTATSRILNYFGIDDSEKIVFFSIMPANIANETLMIFYRQFELKKPGHGITFTCPISHGCYHKTVHLPMEDGGKEMEAHMEHEHDIIFTILNRGFTEEVMDSARAAGANGGTVLHARGTGLKGAEKFFGITIQPEKEILLIVAKVDNTCAIMDSIAGNNGPGSDANAVSFSMPASEVRGMGGDVNFNDDKTS